MEVPAACKASTAKNYQDILKIHLLSAFRDTGVLDITRNKPVDEGFKGSSNEEQGKRSCSRVRV